MTRLTTEEIEAIRKRAINSSASPWLLAFSKSDEPVVIQYDTCSRVTEEIPLEADAEFIANARTDIPKLLAEVERLRVKNSELLEWNRYYLAENKRLKYGGDDE